MLSNSRKGITFVAIAVLVPLTMLWTPLAAAKSCNSLLLFVSGSGDDQSFAGIVFRGTRLGEPILKPIKERVEPVYRRSGIDVVYFRYYFGNMRQVYKRVKNRINERRARCPQAPIGVLGYSWGGDGAYKIAETSDENIQALVTLDPVSLFGNPNPTRYREGLYLFNKFLAFGVCAASALIVPPAAPAVCGTAAAVMFANIGVKITTDMLGDGNVPNPKNVDSWIHVWATGDWEGSDALAAFGAWQKQKHPDVMITSSVSHDSMCSMYKEAEKWLLPKLTNRSSRAARWNC